MTQDFIIIEKRHKRFIKKICESEIVFALKNKKGFATSSSVNYKDDKEERIGIICFWAVKALAKSCIQSEWNRYKVTEIPLSDFMENWCIGMGKDGLLVGTEFDKKMFGFEAKPLELILELSRELNAIAKDLNFKKFDGIADMEKQVKAIIK